MKTIFAQSTGRGKAGVAVIRISGLDALATLQKITKRQAFEPNRMYLAELYGNDNLIDKAMVVYFKSPHSFTGEDVVELHTHGSIAVVRMLTTTLLDLGIDLAEPGEFSKRSFLNGKMDLTSAEGLADLIDSETEVQHRQAMRHMSGELEALCNSWREKLLKSLALMEAYIDFPDDAIPDAVLESTQNIIDNLKGSLQEKLGDNRRGERLRNGITMAVLGEPNVGKSSLMNFLSQRDVSIISDIAGTTRDVVETHLDIGGYPIILADTAGLRASTDDVIEKEGMSRAIKAAESTDIRLVMIDARTVDDTPKEIIDLIDDNTIIVVNKVDLVDSASSDSFNCHLQALNRHPREGGDPVFISVKQKIGLETLIAAITNKAELLAGNGETISITRDRHRRHITLAAEALERCDIKGDLVLAAEDLRIAARNLSLMTGKIEVEEILGEIFSNFCIGK